MNNEGLDKLDHAILDVLKDHARMSYSDIGERVGVSRVAVKNRMEVMEKSGIIRGYKTIIDETKVPEGVNFTLDVDIIPERFQEVVDRLARDKFLRQIYSTTGECRIHCIGFAPNQRTLDSYAKHLFRSLQGIRSFKWNVMLHTIKDLDGGVDYEECKELEHLEGRGTPES